MAGMLPERANVPWGPTTVRVVLPSTLLALLGVVAVLATAGRPGPGATRAAPA